MKKKNTMRKLLRYLKKYWLLLILSLLFAALTVAMTLYLPILIGQAVDLIVAPGQVEFSTIAVCCSKWASSSAQRRCRSGS